MNFIFSELLHEVGIYVLRVIVIIGAQNTRNWKSVGGEVAAGVSLRDLRCASSLEL